MKPCDKSVFKNGKPILAVDTGATGGAKTFEEWVQKVATQSGQAVDWHYSGGIAQVLFVGDRAAVLAAIDSIPLPSNGYLPNSSTARYFPGLIGQPMRVLRRYEEDALGLYRAGVTEAPEGAVAGFMDPISGEQAYICEVTSCET